MSAEGEIKASRGDGQGGDGTVLLPQNGQYDSVVLWMHGLGDSANGWAPAMPALNLPTTKFILPTAEDTPITINGGMEMPGWFDLYGLDPSSPEDVAGFEKSTARIMALINAEVQGGIPASRIAVCGFSQGGALALHVGLRGLAAGSGSGEGGKSFAGVAALSAWLPLRDTYPGALGPGAAELPILQCHGDADQVVNYAWGKG
eukprot:CAMPEP_0172601202 /NCGR_PEP_ID=MMETSP1068-20121228/21371_1 /TAXON_ID=35684 /ORGANISM="Pseudopedinella elastica, Strain CCMP716" /LENGTH=202 /DNA_ID=CAMNT_0013402111 /DNA_START=117 /DNA_END=722 /DNA_ORIENTATION=-